MEEVNIIVGDDGVVECSSITGFFGQDHLHNVGMMPQMDVMAPAHRPLHGQVAHEEDVTTSTTTADHSMSSQMEKEVEDDSYEESFHERCIICGIVINKMKGGWVNIQEETTSTSEKQLVDMIHSVIAESPDVRYRFMTHTMCRRCYNLLDRADEIQVKMKVMQEELTSIKTDMRQTFKLTSTSNKDIVKVVKDMRAVPRLPKNGDYLDSNVKGMIKREALASHPNSWQKSEIKLNIGGGSFSCPACLKSFPTKPHLLNHFDSFHSQLSSVKCSICRSVCFGGIKNFLLHMATKHPGHNIDKGSATLNILDKTTLTNDLSKINENTIGKFMCGQCNNLFTSTFKLREHILVVHSKNELENENTDKSNTIKFIINNIQLYRKSHWNGYQCPLCRKTLKNKKLMKSHLETVHSSKQKNKFSAVKTKAKSDIIGCPHCNIVCKNMHIFRFHLQQKHPNLRKYKCPMCSELFFAKYKFFCHILSHKSEDDASKSVKEIKHEKEFIIDYEDVDTNVEFTDLITSEPEVLICEVSDEDLELTKNTRKIVKCEVDDDMVNGQAYQIYPKCNICHLKFEDSAEWNKHIKFKHSVARNIIQKMPKGTEHEDTVACPLCDARMKYDRLFYHLCDLHTRERVYSCAYCDKYFTKLSGLRSHKKMFHTDKVNLAQYSSMQYEYDL